LIAIVAAMKDEVLRLGSLGRRSKGKIGVTVTGVGKDNAVAATELLFGGSPRPSLVLSLGFSGALSDDLNTGDLVLARRVHLLDSATVLKVDNRCYQLAEEAIHEKVLPYVRRDTLTVPKLVRTRVERERLAQAYNAQAVSMEDYWICNAALRAGVPFLSVKAVLDMTSRELPPYVEEIMWQRERRQGLSIIFGSLAHPLRIPTLLSLARAARKAQKSLDIFTRAFVGKAMERGVLSLA
jgi:nucleoside phosphorylase